MNTLKKRKPFRARELTSLGHPPANSARANGHQKFVAFFNVISHVCVRRFGIEIAVARRLDLKRYARQFSTLQDFSTISSLYLWKIAKNSSFSPGAAPDVSRAADA